MLICALCWACSPTRAVGGAATGSAAVPADPAYFLIRADDAGMSHSANTGLERLITSGLPVAISLMFPTPWYLETVEMLKRHPDVSVGIHLTLNSEWKNSRWGPVLGRSAVPTLVDSNNDELGALIDMNTDYPLPDMSKHRQAELSALTSPRLIDAVRARQIRLVTYRRLVGMQGLHVMRRPEG